MDIQRKAIVLAGGLLLAFSGAFAQSYVESALTFTRTNPGGSARIQGMAGAQTALGGDYSSAHSNPAGLGMFNRSEITFTPAFSTYRTQASFLDGNDDTSDSRINIPGISGVFHMPIENSGFIGGSFAISLTRTNDFNRSTFYHGRNTETSIIDSFLDNAFGDNTSQFDDGAYNYNTPTGLAYHNFLIGPEDIIDPTLPDDVYFTDVRGIPDQQENIRTRGASNQWNFAYGANYKDKLYLGLGIGVVSLRYKNQKTYAENFTDDDVFNNLQLDETLDIRGNGINATLGVIVRPVDFLQVGASFTTPTYYELSESYSAYMRTSWKNFDYYGDGREILNNKEAGTDVVMSDYTLTTPMKISTGVAFLSKWGLITGDVQFINPAKARYSSNIPGVNFNNENADVRSTFATTVNYRVGGEFRYNIFRARAGYGVQGSTYNSSFDIDNSIRTISGGLGIRIQKFYTDFALVHSSGTVFYQPYGFFDGPGPVAELDQKTTTGMITFGFNF